MQQTVNKIQDPQQPRVYTTSVDLFINSQLTSVTGNWSWDLNSDAVFCSDVIITLPLHYPGTTGIVHPDDLETVKHKLSLINQGEEVDFGFRMITTYGEVKFLSGTKCSRALINELKTPDPVKELVHFKENDNDVKKAGNAYYHLKEILQLSEKLNHSGSWYIKANTGEVYYSDNVYRIHGVLPQSMNTHINTFNSFIHPDDRQTVTETFDKSYQDGLPIHIEYRIIAADGTEKFISLTTHWCQNYKGETLLIALMQDESERLLATQKAENMRGQLQFFEQLLQMTERSSHTGYWHMNVLTRQTFYSDNYYRMHGLKPQSIPANANTFTNYIHPDDREKVLDAIKKIRKEHLMPEIEYRIIRPDRKMRYIRQSGRMFPYGGGELVIAGIITDITADKNYEEKLNDLKAEVMLKELIQKQTNEMAGISSWYWELNGGTVKWSDNFYDLLGYKRTVRELTRKELLQSILPEDRKTFTDEMTAVLEGLGEKEFQFRILRTGEIRTVKACFKLFNHDNKKYFTATFQDITEGKLLEQQLYEGLQLNQLLAENIIDIVFITDVNNNILLWNRKCEHVYNLKKEDVLGRNYFDVFPAQKNEVTINRFNSVLKGDFIIDRNDKILPRHFHDLSMLPLKGDDDSVIGILHILHDVTREFSLHTALNDRLDFIENLMNETVDSIIVFDKNLVFTYWNKKAEQQYRINKEYTVGKNLLEVFPSVINSFFYLELKRALKGETVHIDSQKDILDEDRFSESYLVPLFSERKDVNGVLWIAHDLTRIKQAENDLKQNKELLQSVFDTSIDSIIVLKAVRDRSGGIVDFEWLLENKTALRNTGKSMIGKRYMEEYPGVKDTILLEQYKKVVEENAVANFELPYHADGIEGMFHIVAVKVGDGLVATAEDITDRKRGEQELNNSRESLAKQNKLYAYAEEIAKMGTWAWDPETNKAFYSDNMYRLFGLEPGEVEPGFDTIPPFIHSGDRQRVLDSAKELKKGTPTIIEYRVIRKDGETRNFRNCAQIVQYNNDKYVIGVTQDITDVHEKEVAQQAFEMLSKRKDDFIGIASHELKTPVTTIKASMQLLQEIVAETPGTENISSLLERCLRQANHLAELVNDLLDATIIAEGKIQLKRSEFQLADAVKESADEMCMNVKDCIIKIECADPVTIVADKIRIQQVVANLISNAVKYSPHKKIVNIKIEKGPQIKVSVSDQGIGIPEETLQNVFERYFRVEKTSRISPGLGLGLYISKEIIKKHGGTVGVSSEEGKGSTFWFTLPL